LDPVLGFRRPLHGENWRRSYEGERIGGMRGEKVGQIDGIVCTVQSIGEL